MSIIYDDDDNNGDDDRVFTLRSQSGSMTRNRRKSWTVVIPLSESRRWNTPCLPIFSRRQIWSCSAGGWCFLYTERENKKKPQRRESIHFLDSKGQGLTFSAVISHAEGSGDSFQNPLPCGTEDSSAETKHAASGPAGVVSEEEGSEGDGATSKTDGYITGEKGSPSLPLTNHGFGEILFRPLCLIHDVEIAVNDDDLDLDGG